MSKITTTTAPAGEPVRAEDAFLKHLGWYHHIGDGQPGSESAVRDLIQLCGAVWDNTKKIPPAMWHDVREVIGSWREADDWEAVGHTFSGAARRIRPVLIARLEKRAA